MKLTRRKTLGLMAAVASVASAGLAYTIFPRTRQQRARHILPSVTDNSISLSVSLEMPSQKLELSVNGNKYFGRKTDTEGRFWTFQVEGLKPATEYLLQLSDAEIVIEKEWPLRTFPGWNDMPSSFKLMAFTCAGGGDGLSLGDKQFFKPHKFRQKLFDEGLAKNPDAVVSIGDHIYYDLKGQEVPKAGKGLIKHVAGWYMRFKFGAFDRGQSILGTKNEALLKKICDEQIADLYGTRFKSVPVFFVADDHDYFENDDANEEIVTFPPDSFSKRAFEAVADLYYPPLPHSPAPELRRQFGILRYGRLFEAPLYDCAGKLSFSGDNGSLIPEESESWLKQRISTSDAMHFALVPSHPMGWTAGKWREWYPDVVAPAGYTGLVTNTVMDSVEGKLSAKARKYLWPKGWWHQHQRLLNALYQRPGSRFTFSGDIHAQGAVMITKSGNISMQSNPVTSVLVGPVSTSDATWPSAARGIAAAKPDWLETQTLSDTSEINGFSILEVDQRGMQMYLHDSGGNDRRKGEDGRVQQVHKISILG